MKNPNEIEKFGLSAEQLDALFERSNADAVTNRDDRQQAAMWPHHVEQVLVACVQRIVSLEARVVELEARKP